MGYLLLFRRQFHIVAVGRRQVFDVAVHGLVRLALEKDVNATGYARAGNASLNAGTHFGKVAYIFRLLMTGAEFVEECSNFSR